MDFLSKLDHDVYETRVVDLGEFHESYRGVTFDVWVTPSRAHKEHWGEITAWAREQVELNRAGKLEGVTVAELSQQFDDRKLEWLAETWRNCTLEEARQIRTVLLERNPDAWEWLEAQTHKTISDYRQGKLKN